MTMRRRLLGSLRRLRTRHASRDWCGRCWQARTGARLRFLGQCAKRVVRSIPLVYISWSRKAEPPRERADVPSFQGWDMFGHPVTCSLNRARAADGVGAGMRRLRCKAVLIAAVLLGMLVVLAGGRRAQAGTGPLPQGPEPRSGRAGRRCLGPAVCCRSPAPRRGSVTPWAWRQTVSWWWFPWLLAFRAHRSPSGTAFCPAV